MWKGGWLVGSARPFVPPARPFVPFVRSMGGHRSYFHAMAIEDHEKYLCKRTHQLVARPIVPPARPFVPPSDHDGENQ